MDKMCHVIVCVISSQCKIYFLLLETLSQAMIAAQLQKSVRIAMTVGVRCRLQWYLKLRLMEFSERCIPPGLAGSDGCLSIATPE